MWEPVAQCCFVKVLIWWVFVLCGGRGCGGNTDDVGTQLGESRYFVVGVVVVPIWGKGTWRVLEYEEEEERFFRDRLVV